MSKPSPDATSSSPRSDKGTQGPAKSKDRGGKNQAPSAPAEPGVARIVAIANQKGGVGKSTTAVSLGAALAELGFRILVVDLDPQGNASTGMGIRHEARGVTVYDVVLSEAPVESAIVPTSVKHLDAVPSTIDLAGAEIELVSQFSRETRLKKALAPVGEGRYDFIFLDCPPSLGLLTINALTAAEELIVPIQCEYYALEGLGQLLRNVNLVQQNINPELRLTGIVMTMFDPRTKLSEQVVEEVRRFFGEVVYDVVIPRTVRLSEAPGFGQPITVYDPRSKGADPTGSWPGRSQPDRARKARCPCSTIFRPSWFRLHPAMPVERRRTRSQRRRSRTRSSTQHQPPRWRQLPSRSVPRSRIHNRSRSSLPSQTRSPNQSPRQRPTRRWPQPQRIWGPTRFRPHRHPPSRWTRNRSDRARSGGPRRWRRRREPRVRPPRQVMAPGRLPERRVVVIGEDAEIDIEAAREPLVQVPQRVGPPVDRASDIGETLQDEDAPKRRWRLFRKGGQ